MFIIIILLAVSVAAGYALRHIKALRTAIPKGMTATVIALLFIFGTNIGSSEAIMGNLHRYGLKALLIAALGVAGSYCATTLFYRARRRKGGAR